MNAEILQGFIEETQSRLPEICDGITAYWQDTNAVGELRKSLRHAQTIKNAALTVGLTEVSEVGGLIGDELEKIIYAQSVITPQQNQFLLEQISKLEFVLILARESADGICIEDDDLNEDFFGLLELKSPQESIAFEKAETIELAATEEAKSEVEQIFEADEFEIDAEMLEIFAIEAEDHLRNIGANLTLLEQNSDNRDALLEIRHSAHTLKGSAGIIGFGKLSALAHRVEDLLDYISENEIASNQSIFELLIVSTDCLEVLTNGQDSIELDRKIAEIYNRFDEITASLQGCSESKKETASTPENIELNKPEEEIMSPMAVIVSEENSESIENQAQIVNMQNRSVVRVSLERLDDLVKLVSEMIVSRSVFERRLVEFEQQIQELLHTTNRLRRSSGKLEVDFEASTLGNRNFGFQSYNTTTNASPFFEQKEQEFDTLEFDRYTEFHQTTRELVETAGDVSAIHNEFDNLLGNLGSLFDTQRRLVEEMQDNLMRLRMVPLNSLAARLHRTVRVTANEEGKQADLEIENGDIEIDTQILDTFVEPLIHLLRNAVAHGIEPPDVRRQSGKTEKGRITLRAYSEGTHVVFVISDDGQGISASSLKEKAVSAGFITQKEADAANDEEAFSLIFLPGLSTAAEINQVSGRGVGMNIVKSSIARRQGTISIKSELQKGTSFTIRLPMSLAVTRALLIKANEQIFAVPLKIVKQIVEVSSAELEKMIKEDVYKFNGVSYNFFGFNELINIPASPKFSDAKTSLLLLETSETPCALAVDHLLRPEEIVIKPLGSLLQNIPELIGATIMGDGSVVPVLDLVYLVKKKEKTGSEKREPEISETEVLKPPQTVCVLIIDDSPSVRHINSNLIKNAGWLPVAVKDGLEALEFLQTARELPCAILTDVEMPRMDGYEFLSAIKRQENLRQIPVLMVTSRSSDKHRRKAYNLGVSEYINKPFEESVLIEKIKQLIK